MINLQEISIKCSLEELKKLIEFFKEVEVEHGKVIDYTEMCHSHYRDWDKTWTNKESDIIVVTEKEKK